MKGGLSNLGHWPILIVGGHQNDGGLMARAAARAIPKEYVVGTTLGDQIDGIYAMARMERREAAPFRAPHHTVSEAAMRGALVGGREKRLVPGECSLAHGGVLVLHDAEEFHPRALGVVLEAMRNGEVGVVNTRGDREMLPAKFWLIAITSLEGVKKLEERAPEFLKLFATGTPFNGWRR